ncbi:UxaA family hydrolase [Neobacillus vireti]|uniref:UxaA family hydrolase n=1 Tax=Neobacillus vireti TaxID=220686 RepID=UPI002FFFDE96
MKNRLKFVVLNPQDNVGVALDNLLEGEILHIAQDSIVTLKNMIEFGHKFSLQSIKQGDFIIKYGEIIGRSSRNIESGEHVHIHNVEGNRGRGDQIEQNG